jgi:hypothetical protein
MPVERGPRDPELFAHPAQGQSLDTSPIYGPHRFSEQGPWQVAMVIAVRLPAGGGFRFQDRHSAILPISVDSVNIQRYIHVDNDNIEPKTAPEKEST